MNRREFLGSTATSAVALAGLGAAAPAWAQAKLALKASDVHPAGYPTVVAVENIGKKLEAATKGRLSVAMYPAMQLGGEKEAIEQAQVGAIAFARVSVGALGPVIDDLNVFNLPYVFRNTEHMQHVIDGPIGQDLLDKVTNSGKGLVGLCERFTRETPERADRRTRNTQPNHVASLHGRLPVVALLAQRPDGNRDRQLVR